MIVSDRSDAGFSQSATAPRSSPASIHRVPVPSGTRDSGRLDFVPAHRHRGGSVFDTPGTSTAAATRSGRDDHGYPTAESRPLIEQPFGRVTPEKSRAFCGRGVLFPSVEVSHREPDYPTVVAAGRTVRTSALVLDGKIVALDSAALSAFYASNLQRSMSARISSAQRTACSR